jgi:hypothetical protein
VAVLQCGFSSVSQLKSVGQTCVSGSPQSSSFHASCPLLGHPVVDPVVEPVVEPEVELSVVPVVEPVVELVVDPVVELVLDPDVEPPVVLLVEPVVDPVVGATTSNVIELLISPPLAATSVTSPWGQEAGTSKTTSVNPSAHGSYPGCSDGAVSSP